MSEEATTETDTDLMQVETDSEELETREIRTHTYTMSQFGKLIDHYGAVREDNLSDVRVRAELEVAKEYNVRAACVRPDCMGLAREILGDTDVRICAIVGYPYTEDETVDGRYEQARLAIQQGAHEIDLIPHAAYILLNLWPDVFWEVLHVNGVVRQAGGTMNVVMANTSCTNDQRTDIGNISRRINIACVGLWPGTCAGLEDEELDRSSLRENIQAIRLGVRDEALVKVVCCLYNLSDAAYYLASGAHRVGTTDTALLMAEFGDWYLKDKPLEFYIGDCLYRMYCQQDQTESSARSSSIVDYELGAKNTQTEEVCESGSEPNA